DMDINGTFESDDKGKVENWYFDNDMKENNSTTGSVDTATNSTSDFGMESETNSTRRNLRQGKTPYRGPCHTTNPIDRCWRCRRNWDTRRKRLARSNVHIAYGAGITLQFVSNVIIHGLHVHHICTASDGISIFGSTNVWIDHVSMSRCQDGLIDAIQGSTAITISNCHFTHHNDVILLGASDSFSGDQFMQVTVAFNHFGQGLVQRMPRCRWGFFHVVNNDYTHWKMYAIGGSMHPTIISQGNRFIAPNDLALKEVTKRDYATEAEWKNWIWRSEGDMFMNGAFFVQSGQPHMKTKKDRKYMIKAKPGAYATRMTRFAGALNCRPGRKC
ncbi:hypothetical protein P3X46_020004, partial [Hevea brasiliensis]